MHEWEKEFDEKFNIIKPENTRETKIKAFIQAQLDKAREEERQKTWDNVKDIYDTTDYKKQINKAREEVASEIIEWIEGEGYNKWIDGKGYYAINDEGLEQLKEKYKGVGYEPFPAKI